MPVELDKLYEALIELCKIKQLKATGVSSMKAGLVAGAATVVGGLLLGRVGLLLGAAIGGGTAAALVDDFKPVWIILRDLPQGKRKVLLAKVIDAFKNIGIAEVASIVTFLLSDTSLQSVAIKEIVHYAKNELNLRIM